MKIGFLNNQIDNRGTGNAIFDYAHYNEELLNNNSFIIIPDMATKDPMMEARLLNRFDKIYTLSEAESLNLDLLYHIKGGNDDGQRGIPGVPYAVHAVFHYGPHGDKYAMISSWLGKKHSAPFVPHIVSLPEGMNNIRENLGIPQSDIVFGRHGGNDTFDIGWAWLAINRVLEARSDVWFLMMNTNGPEAEIYDPKRVIFVDPAYNPVHKRVFINTCDAMLHARWRGETFGIAVGEFAICNKTIFTYKDSPEQAHIEELIGSGIPILYDSENSLYNEMMAYCNHTIQQKYFGGYNKYTPDAVMAKFKEVFLD